MCKTREHRRSCVAGPILNFLVPHTAMRGAQLRCAQKDSQPRQVTGLARRGPPTVEELTQTPQAGCASWELLWTRPSSNKKTTRRLASVSVEASASQVAFPLRSWPPTASCRSRWRTPDPVRRSLPEEKQNPIPAHEVHLSGRAPSQHPGRTV